MSGGSSTGQPRKATAAGAAGLAGLAACWTCERNADDAARSVTPVVNELLKQRPKAF